MPTSLMEKLGKWQMMLKAIAQTGLAFTQNPYERERYEELLKLAAEMAVAMSGWEDDEETTVKFFEQWRAEVQPSAVGYVTPKVVVNAAVFDEKNRILLIQRLDRGTWFLPGGWADVGYPPSEIAVKEVREETGLFVEPLRLIAILDGFRHKFSLGIPFYCLVYECQVLGGQLRPLPHECKDAKFFSEKGLPEPLHGDGRWVRLIFELKRGNLPIPYSD
ncbi:MAG: NUDIX hydrolase N-terminal domain-containing protein [Armatimonadetes bacterium]|nr:NUDIX hydrolase N-terminal domain-containing protein [Armatimonadota bacterium]